MTPFKDTQIEVQTVSTQINDKLTDMLEQRYDSLNLNATSYLQLVMMRLFVYCSLSPFERMNERQKATLYRSKELQNESSFF
jgi:hypothetical protein